MAKSKHSYGHGTRIHPTAFIDKRVKIGDGCTIESGAMIYEGVELGAHSYVGPNVILGERLRAYYANPKKYRAPKCSIGHHSILRAGTIVYGDVRVGHHFETGPYVTIREKTEIGHHTRMGNFCDIQGCCKIGNYVSAHSNVTVGQYSGIEDYVWMHPYVILLNDWYPPTSLETKGPLLRKYSVIGAGSVVFPGVQVGEQAVIGAHTDVKSNVEAYKIISGDREGPGIDARKIIVPIHGKLVHPYPWRHHRKQGYPWEKSKKQLK